MSTTTIQRSVLKQHLDPRQICLAFQVIRGKVSFLFRGRDRAGVALGATALENLRSIALADRWCWRNETTLESREEIVIAITALRVCA